MMVNNDSEKKIYVGKHSISIQLVVRCVLIIIGTMLFIWVLNVFFLEKYYGEIKRERLYDTYSLLGVYSSIGFDETFDEEMNRICSTYNISYIVCDDRSNVIKTSAIDGDIMRNALRSIVIGIDKDSLEIISKNDRYFYANHDDAITGMKYIIMSGTLPNGNFFLARTTHEGIMESVTIFNKFLFWVGAIGTLVGSIIIYFVSRKITMPIAELASLSERMTRLDFSKKYTSLYNNEIDLLGANFNQMSETLKNTIAELQSANEKLQEDVEAKVRIDNMRKEFLSNVSHELKTPIALIRGYAEGLKEGITDDPETLDFYCDVIMDESEKMNHLVLQLMKLNSLEFGNDEPECVEFDIVEMITNTISSSEIFTKEKNVSVEFKHEDSHIIVWADEYQIEEVIRNYFNNSVNHIDGERKIIVKANKIQDEVLISVYNTGEHIPEESIEHLWGKFYKVDKARTRAYGGSGIGLSIVKAIMDRHKGKCGVKNVEDGVEFWFSIPDNVSIQN